MIDKAEIRALGRQLVSLQTWKILSLQILPHAWAIIIMSKENRFKQGPNKL